MAEEDLTNNPFAALFPSLSEAQQFTAGFKAQLPQDAGEYISRGIKPFDNCCCVMMYLATTWGTTGHIRLQYLTSVCDLTCQRNKQLLKKYTCTC